MDLCHRQFHLHQKHRHRHRLYLYHLLFRHHRYRYPRLGLVGSHLLRLGCHHRRYLGYLDLSLRLLPLHHLSHHRQSLDLMDLFRHLPRQRQKRHRRRHRYRHCLQFHLRLYRYLRLDPVGNHLLHLGYRHHLYLGY